MQNNLAVIMSLYKNDKLEYVKMAVESILNQTYAEFDFYTQYDGPIREDIDNYLSSLQDSCVFIQKCAENKGLAQSLNDLLGIVMPKGYEFIARMDSDDISKPERFEKQIAFLQVHPDINMVGGAINEIDGEGYDRGKTIRYPYSAEICHRISIR